MLQRLGLADRELAADVAVLEIGLSCGEPETNNGTLIEHSDSNRWFLQERPSQCTESLGLAEVNNNMWYLRHINKASQTMKLIFNRTYWKPHCDAIGKKQPQCNNSVSRLHVHIKNRSLSLTLRIISAVLDSNTRGSTLTLPRGSIPTLLFRFSYFPTVNF